MTNKRFKTLSQLLFKHYLLIGLFSIVLLVGIVTLYKSTTSPPIYIYAKIKVGQGYWWASTTKPSLWYINTLKKGKQQPNILGNTIATIEEVRYYPSENGNEYDLYILAKLEVEKNNKTNQFSFNRVPLQVASPIELNLQNIKITGTVIDLDQKPLSQRYTGKTITLISNDPYNLYLYESIKIGDTYFDGTESMLQIINKQLENETIIIQAEIKVKHNGNDYIYGEQKITPGLSIPLATNTYFFANYTITGIK